MTLVISLPCSSLDFSFLVCKMREFEKMIYMFPCIKCIYLLLYISSKYYNTLIILYFYKFYIYFCFNTSQANVATNYISGFPREMDWMLSATAPSLLPLPKQQLHPRPPKASRLQSVSLLFSRSLLTTSPHCTSLCAGSAAAGEYTLFSGLLRAAGAGLPANSAPQPGLLPRLLPIGARLGRHHRSHTTTFATFLQPASSPQAFSAPPLAAEECEASPVALVTRDLPRPQPLSAGFSPAPGVPRAPEATSCG